MNRKELDPDSSPQAAFGARLRSTREARGWTQDELAERMGYSSVHISAVETARKPPTLRFSRSVDQAFENEGPDTFERDWRELQQGSLLEGFPELVAHEPRATDIRLFELGIIPGLLQTPEYAAAITTGAVRRGAITEQQAERRQALLAERQASLKRTPSPRIYAVLDESCIRRWVGGDEVMATQLDRLITFAELPNTVLQVAPFDLGERRAFDLPVTILTLDGRINIAYAESAQRGQLERESAYVQSTLTAYHLLQAEALSQAASVALINQVRKGIP